MGSKQDGTGIFQEREEQDIGELQRQGQDELADLESSPPLELEHGGVHADQNIHEIRAENYSVDETQEGVIQVGVSTPKSENSPAQDHEPQQDGTQEDAAQEQVQEHAAKKIRGHGRGQEHRTQEDRQEERAHEDGTHEDGAYSDMAQGVWQADRAQETGQEDEAHKDGQDGGAYEDNVREYRARKRRVVTEDSDDGGALRAQQVREGRKLVDKQRQVSTAQQVRAIESKFERGR